MDLPVFRYQQRIGKFNQEISKLRKPLRWIPWLRLLSFFLTGILLYYHFSFHGFIFILGSVSSFTLFLWAGWYDYRLKKQIAGRQLLITINEQEVKSLNDDYSGFDPGHEFVDQDHPYTHDLDIFGERSLFQYLNRTATIFGRKRLADYFIHAFNYSGEIPDRQQSVQELAGMIDLRQNLLLLFSDHKTSEGDLLALTEWLNGESAIRKKKQLKYLSLMLPSLTLTMLILSLTGLIPYQIPSTLIIMQLLIVFGFGRKTQVVHQAVSSQVGILKRYSEALTLLQDVRFTSDFNKKLLENLKSDDHAQPGTIIRKLANLLNMLDSNLNMLASVILNGLFMFNIHVILATEGWRLKYRHLVPGWFSVLAEADAISSLGNYSFNHPGNHFPQLAAAAFEFRAVQLGHPLIAAEICVKNDIDIAGWNQFRIITGANMSGKSTFLRTIGTNYLLAMMGAPVCAERMIFTPIEIHSSIRTNDSLARRESYFYAELKRLKEIIDELKSGRTILILLDEILKGTNSADKQSGSIALIRQLLNYKLVGLFATHDLLLGTLINEFPENIQNLCFEISISGDKMDINYKLAPGVCKNLNASFLMKKMGIIVDGDSHT